MTNDTLTMPSANARETRRRLDIIVPIYRNAALTRVCIASLHQNLGEISDRRPRVILINDSPDDTQIKELLSEPWLSTGDVVQITNDINVGFVRSVNKALELSRTARHDALLVNSDTQTYPGTLRNLLAATEADPQIAFASPRSNNAALCSLPHWCGGLISDAQLAYERWRALAQYLPPWHFSPTAVGFYLFIRFDVLVDQGLLSEEYGRGYEEENDLVMRARKVGKRAIIVNNAFAYHSGGSSFALGDTRSLKEQKRRNEEVRAERHPEFLTLVHRYEASPHFCAEALLSGLIRDDHGRLRIAFDLSGLGEHHNGTNEHTVAVLKALAMSWRHKYRITCITRHGPYRFHGLDRVDGLNRAEPEAPGLHAVAIRLAQPFALEDISRLESLAPTCIYAMLDTIADDCGPLSAEKDVSALWQHVASHANGIIFNSKFSEKTFRARYDLSGAAHIRAQLLSTDPDEYLSPDAPTNASRSHVLVLGNHFPHKNVDATLVALRQAFPRLAIVAIGSETRQVGNTTTLRSGSIEQQMMRQVYRGASVIVLPSYVEGFGMGLMHGIANKKPIVARRIEPTLEILENFDVRAGVELFETEADLVPAVTRALAAGISDATPRATTTWSSWTSELTELVDKVASSPDLFTRLRSRLSATRANTLRVEGSSEQMTKGSPSSKGADEVLTLEQILAMDGKAFLTAAYRSLLGRRPDDEGLESYMTELRRNRSKPQILQAICTSPEASGKVDGDMLKKIIALATNPTSATGGAGLTTSPARTGPNQAPANEINRISELTGREFVTAAYRFVLSREPDDLGMNNYLRMLEQGADRAAVLSELYASMEARATGVHIPELESAREGLSKKRTHRWRTIFSR